MFLIKTEQNFYINDLRIIALLKPDSAKWKINMSIDIMLKAWRYASFENATEGAFMKSKCYKSNHW